MLHCGPLQFIRPVATRGTRTTEATRRCFRATMSNCRSKKAGDDFLSLKSLQESFSQAQQTATKAFSESQTKLTQAQKVAERTWKASQETLHKTQEALQSAHQTSQAVVQSAKERAAQAQKTLKQAQQSVQQARQSVKEAQSNVTESAKRANQSVKHTIHQAQQSIHNAQQSVQQAQSSAKESAKRANESVKQAQQTVKEAAAKANPLPALRKWANRGMWFVLSGIFVYGVATAAPKHIKDYYLEIARMEREQAKVEAELAAAQRLLAQQGSEGALENTKESSKEVWYRMDAGGK